MRYLISLALYVVIFSSTHALAYNGSNGNQGRTLGPEIQCMTKNGDIISTPVEYCKLLEGKEM